MRQIVSWLEKLSLGQYAQRFDARSLSYPLEITSHGFLPPIHCKSVPGIISSYPCL
jgi:hypothetical protein